MTTWAERAKARFSERAPYPTDETDETPGQILEMRRDGTDETDETGVLSVLAVPPPRIFKNEVLLRDLIAAAMRACDHHGDGPEAREQMRQDCINTPSHLQADLLAHFTEQYGRAA